MSRVTTSTVRRSLAPDESSAWPFLKRFVEKRASPVSVSAAPVRVKPSVSAEVAKRWMGLAPARGKINLALQGGGAHGAFTWGVLDRLLEDPRIELEGLSGSSAGAMNAVVLADGWMKGGREGARLALAEFWTAIGKNMPASMVTQGQGDGIGLNAAAKMMVNMAGYFSPTQLNPFDLNPLRDLLVRSVDFAGLRVHSPFKLFVGTTQASTGKLRVFRESELSAEVLLASACLPKLHHAVQIDGEPYWDGGYSANPAVFPLFYDCDSRDVLLVLLSPLRREGTPTNVDDIEARITELGFNANFMREMRMFVHAREFAGPALMPAGRLERRLRNLRFHMIDSHDISSMQRTDTKLLAHGPFLERLHGQGRERAEEWLSEHAGGIGRRSTVDVKKWFS